LDFPVVFNLLRIRAFRLHGLLEKLEGIENPIVTRTSDRAAFIAVYDALVGRKPQQSTGH
jgi:hypothetical protein